MRQDANAFGVEADGHVIALRDELVGRPTIVDAIRERLAGSEVVHAPGTGLRDGTRRRDRRGRRRRRRRATSRSWSLGERSGLTDDATTGEFRDRRDLGPPRPPAGAARGRRRDRDAGRSSSSSAAGRWRSTGPPTTARRSSWPGCPAMPGRPRSPTSSSATSNPGGKLPITIPRHVGQVPLTYRHHPTGGRSNWKIDYVDGPSRRSGRSATACRTRPSSCRTCGSTGPRLADGGDECDVTVDVTNTGERAGDEVVQLLRPGRGGDRRPAGARAARLPAGQPRARRAPDGDLHPRSEQFAYTGIDRRGRRAGHDQAPRRAVVGRPAADDGRSSSSDPSSTSRAASLPDHRDGAPSPRRRVGMSDPPATPSLGRGRPPMSAFDLPLDQLRDLPPGARPSPPTSTRSGRRRSPRSRAPPSPPCSSRSTHGAPHGRSLRRDVQRLRRPADPRLAAGPGRRQRPAADGRRVHRLRRRPVVPVPVARLGVAPATPTSSWTRAARAAPGARATRRTSR